MENIDYSKYAGWDLPVYLNRLNPIPLDKWEIQYSLTDAETYAKNENLAPIGQIITVVENDKVEAYKIMPDRTLAKVAEGLGSIRVETYKAAKDVASNDNIAQIVYITNESYSYVDESGNTVYTTDKTEAEAYTGFTTYNAGAYIVVGDGVLQKLAQSTASGSIDDEIAAIHTSLSNLDKRTTTIEGEILYISGDDLN